MKTPIERFEMKITFERICGLIASLTDLLCVKTFGVFDAGAPNQANCPETPKVFRPSTLLKMHYGVYVA
jgi:hypothetical protein